MENTGAVPQKLKYEITYDTIIPCLGITQKIWKISWKDVYTAMFIAALFTTAKM